MDFSLSSEQELFRQSVKTFAETKIAPKISTYEKRQEFPWEILQLLAKQDMLPVGAGLPEVDPVIIGITCEELARVKTPLAIVVRAVGLSPEREDAFRNSPVLKVYEEEIGKGNKIIQAALTEPSCGSDAAAIKTTAIPTEDGWIINGEKEYISLVDEASAFIVFAKTSPEKGARGVSAFLIESETTGLKKHKLNPFGNKTTSFGGFVMDDVLVPKNHLLGEKDKGFYLALERIDRVRVMVALWCLGLAKRKFEESLEYVKQRTAFGRPIAKFEAVQFRIAEDATLFEAAHDLCYKALWMQGRKLRARKVAAMAKWWGANVAYRMVNNVMQNYGAMGYTDEIDVGECLATIRAYSIADGTDDIMKIVIGREILGKQYVPYK